MSHKWVELIPISYIFDCIECSSLTILKYDRHKKIFVTIFPICVAQTIQHHGGRVLVQAPVTNIICDSKGRATGVKVAKMDTEIRAKIIISDAGVVNTFKTLLPPQVAQASCKCIALWLLCVDMYAHQMIKLITAFTQHCLLPLNCFGTLSLS